MLDTLNLARHAAFPFKLTAIAALAASLYGCGGGSNKALLEPAPTPTATTPTPATVSTQIAAEPLTTTTTATPVPTNITQTLQLNNGVNRGLSVSATYTANVTGPDTSTNVIISAPAIAVATVTVTPTSGAITRVTLDTHNARLTGSTSVWSAPADQVATSQDGKEFFACAAGPCAPTTLRDLSLETWRPAQAPAYQYLSYGEGWEQSAATGAVQGVLSLIVVGQPTPPASIPTSGSATYTGESGGLGVGSNGSTFDFEASFSATANFVARTVSVGTTGTRDTTGTTAIAAPQHNYSGTLSYAAGSNLFTGPIATATSGITGTATGRFFGPATQEMGGVFEGAGTGVRLMGSFAGKRP